jgi:8-oxo-dGTP pyrophosphatase MutT (NUDIX family)
MSDTPDDRPRRRRRRRRGRGGRSRTGQPAAAAEQRTDDASPAHAKAAHAKPAADAPSATGARKSRSRRRRGGRGTRRRATPTAQATVASTASVAPESVPVDAPTPAAPVAALAPEPSAPSSHDAASARAAARRDRAERETSAGGIVYRVQNGEPLFLLIRDSYRNWGFPKGHLEGVEQPQEAALREVQEETGLGELRLDGAIETIDWFFRFRGKLVHKVCHFYLMHTRHARTSPQREEGITACRWARFDEATKLISYANARAVLIRANEMVLAERGRVATRERAAPPRAESGSEDAAHG